MTRPIDLVLYVLVGLALSGSLRAGGPPKFDMSDEAVWKAVNAGSVAPKGFYSEDLKAGPKESISINCVRQLKNDGRRVGPVAADSLDEARKLTQAFLDRSNAPPEAKKILSEETAKAHYQFKTKHKVGDTTYWTYHRVWRGDFFRPGEDLGSRYLGQKGAYKIGTLTGRRDAETTRWLAEFLWWNEHHSTKGALVLAEPKVTENSSNLTVTFDTVRVVFGDFGVPDAAHVIRWDVTVNRDTGQVTQAVQELRRIKGKRAAGGKAGSR
jgi:hypothetical protein